MDAMEDCSIDFLEASYATHMVLIKDLYNDISLSDIPAFLKEPRRRRNNKANLMSGHHDSGLSRRSLDTSCSSISFLSNTNLSTSLDLNFELENDKDKGHNDEQQGEVAPWEEQQQQQHEVMSRGYFIPGITGTAKCLEGAIITGSTTSRRLTERRRKESSSTTTRRVSSRRDSNESSCSISSGSSRMSRDTYHSISKNLEETRELLRRQSECATGIRDASMSKLTRKSRHRKAGTGSDESMPSTSD